MAEKKITIPDVYKKDLLVVTYLFVFGAATLISEKLGASKELSILFGGIANYIVYRAKQELEGSGYLKALKG